MRLEKCFFCSATCYPGHGITFVRNDSRIFKFCRSKCHAAFKRKRNPRKTRWTKAYRKATGKELTEDPALELEKRRHVPQKYSRELWAKTVEGMKKALEIKEAREAQHVKDRMRKGTEIRKRCDRINVERNIGLIRSPAAPASSKVAAHAALLTARSKAKAKAIAKARAKKAQAPALALHDSDASDHEPEPAAMEAN